MKIRMVGSFLKKNQCAVQFFMKWMWLQRLSDMQPMTTAESGRWCEIVHFVKELMHIFVIICSSWYMLILLDVVLTRARLGDPYQMCHFFFMLSSFFLKLFLFYPSRTTWGPLDAFLHLDYFYIVEMYFSIRFLSHRDVCPILMCVP